MIPIVTTLLQASCGMWPVAVENRRRRRARGDRRLALALGQRRGLQRVLELVDGGEALALGRAAAEDIEEFRFAGHATSLSCHIDNICSNIQK